MKIKYSGRKDAKDLNSVSATSYKPKSFSAKHPLLAKILATCLMFEGVCMPFGSVRAAPREAAGAEKKNEVAEQAKILKEFTNLIPKIKAEQKTARVSEKFQGYITADSEYAKQIFKLLQKLGFVIKINDNARRDGIYIGQGTNILSVYLFDQTVEGVVNLGKLDDLYKKVIEVFNQKQAESLAEEALVGLVQAVPAKTAGKEEEPIPVGLAESEKTKETKPPEAQAEEPAHAEVKQSVKVDVEEVIKDFNGFLDNWSLFAIKLNLSLASIAPPQKINKNDKQAIQKIAQTLFKDSENLLGHFNKMQNNDDKLLFLSNHIKALLHLQDKALLEYIKESETTRGEKEAVKKILKSKGVKVDGFSIYSVVGARMLLLRINEMALRHHENKAQKLFQNKNKVKNDMGENYETFKKIVDLEHERLLHMHDPDLNRANKRLFNSLVSNKLSSVGSSVVQSAFGADDGFFKLLEDIPENLDPNKKEIALYTLLSIAELKLLLDLKEKDVIKKGDKTGAEASLGLAKDQFVRLFINREKEEENMRLQDQNVDLSKAINDNAALVIANAGIAKILPYWHDFAAYINRNYYQVDKPDLKKRYDAVFDLLAYNLNVTNIQKGYYPMRYAAIAQLRPSLTTSADREYVGTLFTNVVGPEQIEKIYKKGAGYHQAFTPALLGIGGGSTNYIVGDLMVKEIISDKFWSTADNIRVESQNSSLEKRKDYQKNSALQDILQKAGVWYIEKLLAFGAPTAVEIKKEEKTEEMQAETTPPAILQLPSLLPERFPQPFMPSRYTAKAGETNYIFGENMSAALTSMFGEEKTKGLYDAFAEGLNAKDPEQVKNAASALYDIILTGWNPTSDADSGTKAAILKALEKAKESGDTADFKMALMTFSDRLGVNLLENFYTYRFEGDTLRVRIPIGIEVALRLGLSESEIRSKVEARGVAFLTGLAVQLGYLYRPVNGRLSEYQLKGFDEQGKLIVEPTGESISATLETHAIDINTALDLLAFKAPEALGGIGVIRVNAAVEIDKASLKTAIHGQPLAISDWVASFKSIGISADFPGGEGLKIRSVGLGGWGIGSISEEGLKWDPTSNWYGNVVLGWTEKLDEYQPLALQRLTFYLSPTVLFGGQTGFSLTGGIQSVHRISENWYALPALNATYLYDGRNNYGQGSTEVLFNFAPWGLAAGLGASLDSNLNYSVMLLFRFNLER